MASTRSRLTVSYAFVLLGTMVAFSTSVWIARRNVSIEQIGQELGPYAFRTGDQVLAAIQAAQLDGKRMTYVDTTNSAHPVIRAQRALADSVSMPAMLWNGVIQWKPMWPQPE